MEDLLAALTLILTKYGTSFREDSETPVVFYNLRQEEGRYFIECSLCTVKGVALLTAHSSGDTLPEAALNLHSIVLQRLRQQLVTHTRIVQTLRELLGSTVVDEVEVASEDLEWPPTECL